ncbi:hypothetical protein ACGFX4_28520 [Kitasatospora sp. NPDC048365]|uniref:hypothetical protein n=1 Tax=Kitasatospora sp. NPDC048365 TaxID=3364050 RepID=UPI0037158085
MSIASSVPVLQGSRGVVLRSVDGALLLTTPREESRIPLAAVERVTVDGRSVAVELTAAPGSAPALHRVGGVSEAAATAFAEAVNRSLPERAEGEAVVDGSALVATRVLDESPRERQQRRIRWGVLAAGVLIVALSLATGIREGGAAGVVLAFTTLLVGPVALAITAVSFAALWLTCRGWYLSRYGITVEANAADAQGSYVYTDTAGVGRAMNASAGAGTVRVAYDPRDPGRAVVHRSGLRTIGKAFGSLVGLGIGLGLDFVMVMVLLTS